MSGFNVAIAYAFGFFALATGWVSSYFGWGVYDEKASRFTKWYRGLNVVFQGIVDGIIASIAGLAGEAWVTDQLLPAFNTGPTAIAIAIVASLISLGLGVSMGKALSHKDYQFLSLP